MEKLRFIVVQVWIEISRSKIAVSGAACEMMSCNLCCLSAAFVSDCVKSYFSTLYLSKAALVPSLTFIALIKMYSSFSR